MHISTRYDTCAKWAHRLHKCLEQKITAIQAPRLIDKITRTDVN